MRRWRRAVGYTVCDCHLDSCLIDYNDCGRYVLEDGSLARALCLTVTEIGDVYVLVQE